VKVMHLNAYVTNECGQLPELPTRQVGRIEANRGREVEVEGTSAADRMCRG